MTNLEAWIEYLTFVMPFPDMERHFEMEAGHILSPFGGPEALCLIELGFHPAWERFDVTRAKLTVKNAGYTNPNATAVPSFEESNAAWDRLCEVIMAKSAEELDVPLMVEVK
jgi:hypothetical protein